MKKILIIIALITLNAALARAQDPTLPPQGTLMVNETLLYRSTEEIISAFKKTIQN